MKGLVRFAREHLGLELYPGQIQVLEAWAQSGARKAVLCLGRRSGKGLLAAVGAIFNAVAIDYSHYLRRGETRFILVVATREQQAREFIRVVRELLAAAQDPDLAALVDEAASTENEVVFRTGVVIRAMPCTSRSTRGLAASMVIFDEFAHMQSDTEGYQAARNVWRALTPSVAQFKEQGYVLVTSTPSWASGAFHDLVRTGEAGRDKNLFVIRKATWEVNSTISRDSLEGEFVADPESARVEYGAEFAQSGGAYLDPDVVLAAVVANRKYLPPRLGVRYIAAADPAFAAGGDSFTFCVAHRHGSGEDTITVLDRLESWRGKTSPLSSDLVLDEIAELAKEYRLQRLVSDQYAVVPLADGLRRRGVTLTAQPLTNELKADIFASLKRALNLGQVELLDRPDLVAELNRLEVRPTATGRPRIVGAGGFKDDLAMVVASVVHGLDSSSSITGNDVERFRELNRELNPSRSAGLRTLVGSPGTGSFGYGRLNG